MDDIEESGENSFTQQKSALEARWETLVNRSTPYTLYRWLGFAVLLLLFLLRILLAEGWYIVCYALGIYLLNMFLAFLTPKFDPSMEQEEEDQEGPTLPTRNDEEFRPFIRRLPEFKFWYSATKGTIIAMICTGFEIFNLPVYVPILVIYFCILFILTMRRQIQHMIKYRYVPFDLGKRKYKKVVNDEPSSSSSSSDAVGGIELQQQQDK